MDDSIRLRQDIWSVTARIIRDFPLTGTGLNTFGTATLAYQVSHLDMHYAEAHNDYLQLAAEGGVLLSAPVLAAVVFTIGIIWRRFDEGGGGSESFWPRLGAVTGLMAVALQSLVDFSLQMPGTAVLFVVFLAVALHRPRSGGRAHVMSTSPGATRRLAVRFVTSIAQVLRGGILRGAGRIACRRSCGRRRTRAARPSARCDRSHRRRRSHDRRWHRRSNARSAWFGLQPTLPTVLSLFVAVSLAHATLVRANSLVGPRLEQRYITSLRQRLYAALIGARWSFLAQQKSSDLVHAVTVDIERVSAATYQLFALATAAAITLIYLVVALRLSVAMTLTAALGGGLLLWAMRRRTQASERLADDYVQASREVMGAAAESMTGLKVLKALGDDGRHVSGFGALSRRFSAAYLAMLTSLRGLQVAARPGRCRTW